MPAKGTRELLCEARHAFLKSAQHDLSFDSATFFFLQTAKRVAEKWD